VRSSGATIEVGPGSRAQGSVSGSVNDSGRQRWDAASLRRGAGRAADASHQDVETARRLVRARPFHPRDERVDADATEASAAGGIHICIPGLCEVRPSGFEPLASSSGGFLSGPTCTDSRGPARVFQASAPGRRALRRVGVLLSLLLLTGPAQPRSPSAEPGEGLVLTPIAISTPGHLTGSGRDDVRSAEVLSHKQKRLPKRCSERVGETVAIVECCWVSPLARRERRCASRIGPSARDPGSADRRMCGRELLGLLRPRDARTGGRGSVASGGGGGLDASAAGFVRGRRLPWRTPTCSVGSAPQRTVRAGPCNRISRASGLHSKWSPLTLRT
jgi:hypothetical protein